MNLLTRMLRNESGQALPMALVLMAVGGFIVVPLLSLSTTNLNASLAINQQTFDTYAADAGVSHGLWKVGYNDIPHEMTGVWSETTYATYEQTPYIYDLYDSDDPANIVTVNRENVEVEIQPIWALQGLEDIPIIQLRTPSAHLLTFGGLNGNGDYEISLFSDGTPNPLLIERIGCWLPPGFHYNGGCNLEQAPWYLDPAPTIHNGGELIIWNFPTPINYNSLPVQGSKRIVTFEFTPGENPVDAFCWTRTTDPTVKLSWDTSKKIFEITSRAPNDSAEQTTIVAHSIKKEFQMLGSAVAGDYQATGVTLMRDHNNDPCPGSWLWCLFYWGGDKDRRERLYNETLTSVKSTVEDPTYGLPADATVEQIFLYWTGWKCKPWDVRNYTALQLAALPLSQTGGKYLNKVRLKVKVNETEFNQIVTATSPPQVMVNRYGNDAHGWTYSCFADVTNQVKTYFEGQGVPFYGIAKYTVGHWDTSPTYVASTYRYALYTWNDNHSLEPAPGSAPIPPLYTRYPLGSPMDGNEIDTGYENSGYEDEWSHAGWSVVIIYSSPGSTGHHLYVYDTFRHCDSNEELPFTIRGFLAPPDVMYDTNAARTTCFVSEGDNQYTGDYFKINNNNLPNPADGVNPQNNVWNGKSNVLGGVSTHEGIDIDQFIAGGGTIIQPGDTEADIRMPTGSDTWNLVYIVLSFRSEITTGGMIDYNIQ